MALNITIGQRLTFEATIDRGRPDDCWPFRGGKEVLVDGRRIRPQWLAAAIHRASALNPDETVRAKCSTPHCCNPAHLRVLHRSDAPFVQFRMVASSRPDRAEEATCSYCGQTGSNGRAVVCGRGLDCPVCSAPGWAELLAKSGADSA